MKEKNKEKNEEKTTEFISLLQAARISGYTAEHLNLLCRKGFLKAKKIGRNWNTTEKWLGEYLSSSCRRDKKRKKIQIQTGSYRKTRSRKIQIAIVKNYQPESVNEERVEPFKKVLDEVAPFKEVLDESEKHFRIIEEKTEKEKSEKIENFLSVTKKEKNLWLGLIARFAFLTVFAFLIFSGTSIFYLLVKNWNSIEESLPVEILEDTFLSWNKKPEQLEMTISGQVKGEEDVNRQVAISASENFRMKEISFGGIVLASTDSERLPLEISDFKTKSFLSKDGKEVQALISWKTNKAAASKIKYYKINSQGEKTLEEKNYGFNHSVVLAKLDLDTTYILEVQVQDRWGNVVTSEKFSVYTGSKVISILELIVKEINKLFGWAVK